MSGKRDAGARILAAQERLCQQLAADLALARAAGAPAAELADLEARGVAASRRYQELAVDIPHGPSSGRAGRSAVGRPWWKIW